MKKEIAVVLAALALVAGCSSGNSNGSSGGSGGGGGSKTLTVFAASSLTETFGSLAKTFEKQHPGVHVKFSFDSSATLAEQVNQGAPADVLATADTKTMKTVTDAGNNAGKPQLFATNTMTLVVPKDNPGKITKFSDINQPGSSYVTCVDTAPCGSLAKTLLAANHITAKPKSQEVDVKSVLGKVELGEADAGMVYDSDAKASAAKTNPVQIPKTEKYINDYPIVAVKGSKNAALAKDWNKLVLSQQGQKVLTDAGFGSP
jgi:molybdate transport system substrate-binding protein